MSGTPLWISIQLTLKVFSKITRVFKAPSPLRTAGAVQIHAAIFSLLFLLFTCITSQAQQPFAVDDADVTEKRKFQLQISHEFDILPRSAYPSRHQNTTVFALNYGLMSDVEIGVDGPLIVIVNSPVATPETIAGFGDLNLHVKYNFLKEREGLRRPALTVSFAVELPTGDSSKQLGSGLVDYTLIGVMQKSLTDKTTLRLNSGIVFAGSAATGEVGISTRGHVLILGGSVVKQFTPKLSLGAELIGGITQSSGGGQLQTQFGGNYQVTEKMSLDFGLIAGKFNSPRAGVQLGISLDF